MGNDDVDEAQLEVMLSQSQQENQALQQQLDQALQLIQSRQIDMQIAQGASVPGHGSMECRFKVIRGDSLALPSPQTPHGFIKPQR